MIRILISVGLSFGAGYGLAYYLGLKKANEQLMKFYELLNPVPPGVERKIFEIGLIPDEPVDMKFKGNK